MLHDIKNEGILKFQEKLLGYNLEFVHVRGSTHSVAGRLSRYTEKEYCHLSRLGERFIYIRMQVARDLASSSPNHTKTKRTETLIIIA